MAKARVFAMELSRTIWEAAKKFYHDNCFVYASSLTYYTLLSVIPMFAIGLVIAKGFGMEQYLRHFSFLSEETNSVLRAIITFVDALLARIRSGIVAGTGMVFLFWLVWSVLHNIEFGFNTIWKTKTDRTITRQITDYVAIIFLFPIIVLLSLGLTIYIETFLLHVFTASEFLDKFGKLYFYIVRFLPLLFSISLVTAMYIILPNTKVPGRHALYGGTVAGILIHIFQYVYVHYQIKLATYNVIYGSFVAFPLLFLWIFYNWVIIFLGMQIVIVRTNYSVCSSYAYDVKLSFHQKRLFALSFLVLIIEKFIATDPRCEHISLPYLSRLFGLPLKTTEKILSMLQSAGLVYEVCLSGEHAPGRVVYQPAFDVYQFRIVDVFERIDVLSVDPKTNHITPSAVPHFQQVTEQLQRVYAFFVQSDWNVRLVDLLRKS